jgi:hypothetical protein
VIAYIDTSALLRVVLRETDALDNLRTYDGLVSSELIAVESARTIDRFRMQGLLTMEEAVERITSSTFARLGIERRQNFASREVPSRQASLRACGGGYPTRLLGTHSKTIAGRVSALVVTTSPRRNCPRTARIADEPNTSN